MIKRVLAGACLLAIVSCGSFPKLTESRRNDVVRWSCEAHTRYCTEEGNSSHPFAGFVYTQDEKNLRCRNAKATMKVEGITCENWRP